MDFRICLQTAWINERRWAHDVRRFHSVAHLKLPRFRYWLITTPAALRFHSRVFFEMPLKVTLCIERKRTKRTVIGFFSCMNSHMVPQIVRNRKGLRAMRTGVRLLAGMHSHMPFQPIWYRKGLITLRTNKRFDHHTVCLQVHPQSIWISKGIWTMSTGIWLPSVSCQMCFQRACLMEWHPTLWTTKWFLSSMKSFMDQQWIWRAERFFTLITWEFLSAVNSQVGFQLV